MGSKARTAVKRMGQSRDNTWVWSHVPGLSSFNLSVMEVCYCPLQLNGVHHEPNDLRPEDALSSVK